MLRNIGLFVLCVLFYPAMLLAFAFIGIAMVWMPEWLLGAIIVGVVIMVVASWPAIVRWERREDAKRRLF